MLLVIHNLPSYFRYADVKIMIKDKCGLTEMIIDNLVMEGSNKKVTVGLADEGDAALLVRKINGLYVGDQQLYVEDVRQKKSSEQPYRPTSDPPSIGDPINQYNQVPYGYPQPQFQQQPFVQQFHTPQNVMPIVPALVEPNFGIPYYMTTNQSNSVENNQRFMVEYPKPQGSAGSNRGDIGFDNKFGGRNSARNRSRSPDYRERSPRRSSGWNESDRDRSDSRRDRDRSSPRNDRYGTDRSYKDNRGQGSSKQDYGSQKSSNKRFQQPSGLSEPRWEQGESYYSRDSRSNDMQSRRSNQDSGSQRDREGHYSQSRDSDYASRRDDSSSKKRPYEMSDKNNFGPQNKKFGSNQQFSSGNKSDTSSGAYPRNTSNEYQSEHANLNKSSIRPNMPHLQQNRPNMHPKVPHVQQTSPRVQPRGPHVQQTRPRMQPQGPHMQPNRPQTQMNRPQVPKAPGKQTNKPRQQTAFVKNSTTPKLQGSDQAAITPEVIAKHEAWRVQAAACIANRINNEMSGPRHKRDPVLVQLKLCVRARLDVILSDDVRVGVKEIILAYGEKFEDDEQFFKAVCEKVDKALTEQHESEYKSKEIKGDVGKKKNAYLINNLSAADKQTKPPELKLPADANVSGQRLPKYPNANKKIISQMKKAQKEEITNDSLYALDDLQNEALTKELDKLDELFKEVLESPQTDVDKYVCKFMSDAVAQDVRKVLSLQVRKRLLDIRTNLSVRVFCQPKPPKRERLDEFLKKYGVLSLQKSAKLKHVFIAVCSSYKNYDALCQLGSTVIDTFKVSFKPLHIAGPPLKGKLKMQSTDATDENIFDDMRGNNEQNMFDSIEDSNFVTGEVTFSCQDSDCEIIPQTVSDVIVIDESVQKSKDVISMDEVNDNSTKIVVDEVNDNSTKIVIDEVNDNSTNDKNAAAELDKALIDANVKPASEGEGVPVDAEPEKEALQPTIPMREPDTILTEQKEILDSKIEGEAEKVDLGNVVDTNDITENDELSIINNDVITEDDLEDF